MIPQGKGIVVPWRWFWMCHSERLFLYMSLFCAVLESPISVFRVFVKELRFLRRLKVVLGSLFEFILFVNLFSLIFKLIRNGGWRYWWGSNWGSFRYRIWIEGLCWRCCTTTLHLIEGLLIKLIKHLYWLLHFSLFDKEVLLIERVPYSLKFIDSPRAYDTCNSNAWGRVLLEIVYLPTEITEEDRALPHILHDALTHRSAI